jgi:hypothetical protein
MKSRCWRFNPRLTKEEAEQMGLCWICDGEGPRCLDWVEMNEEEVKEKYRIANEMVA